jgi:hypothetical protein
MNSIAKPYTLAGLKFCSQADAMPLRHAVRELFFNIFRTVSINSLPAYMSQT